MPLNSKTCANPFKILSCHVAVLSALALASALALGAAYTAQLGFNLAPCDLCLYQRVPFAIVLILSLIGLVAFHDNKNAASMTILADAVLLDFNAIIALYHSGVERKWWTSFLEGCSVPDLGDDPAQMIEAIMNAPVARCDEIPWQDPLLGLSMANYNVVYCFMLASFAMAAFIQIRRSLKPTPAP